MSADFNDGTDAVEIETPAGWRSTIASTSVFSREVGRRRRPLKTARQAGADLIFAVDPDERFDTAVAAEMPDLTRKPGRIAWGFHFRELYAPHSYRVDGIRGTKIRHCLFRAFDPAERTDTGLHDLWYPNNAGFKELRSGLNSIISR